MTFVCLTAGVMNGVDNIERFQRLSDIPTRLFAFSDDMDGLRKVPTNVPNQEMLTKYIGIPLTKIPDPFGSTEYGW